MSGKRGWAYASIFLVNVLWGLSFIASKAALGSGLKPFSLAMCRFGLASVCLMPILWRREGRIALPKRHLGRLFLSSLFGVTLYFLFEYGGLERTSASTASLIIATIPALTLIAGAVIHKRRYAPVCFLGVALSLIGVFLIVRYGAQDGQDSLTGNLLILGACLCWVAYIEVTNGLIHDLTNLEITAWQSAFGFLTLVPLALTERVDWAAVTPVAWWMVAYLALFCSVVAYLLYAQSIRVLKPLTTAMFINVNPLAAVLGGVLILNEALAPMQLIGGAIVLGSIFLVNRQSA